MGYQLEARIENWNQEITALVLIVLAYLYKARLRKVFFICFNSLVFLFGASTHSTE
jgi:hypothetical protein